MKVRYGLKPRPGVYEATRKKTYDEWWEDYEWKNPPRRLRKFEMNPHVEKDMFVEIP